MFDKFNVEDEVYHILIFDSDNIGRHIAMGRKHIDTPFSPEKVVKVTRYLFSMVHLLEVRDRDPFDRIDIVSLCQHHP